ncbi:unnamed protein product [Cuscuta epithymum]|nr:unnamed protein product [Cuscuta epithymum]
MSDLALLCYYFGIEVKQVKNTITLSQTGYAKKILEKMGMAECNPCCLPMEPRSKLNKYMEAPTTAHLNVVKQILRYVKGTIDFGCVYKREQTSEGLIGYSDSDLAEDLDDGKSTTKILYFLNDSPITWVSQKQRIVVLSSCEAEYIAATSGACQGIWLTKLLESILESANMKPVLRVQLAPLK